MPRFRSIEWHASPRNLDLTKRAPLLQSLVLRTHVHGLRGNLLGEVVASLRTLRIGDTCFPLACPALATLTELHAGCPWYISGDLGVHRIFALCPRLEVLHLRDVHDRPDGALPSGPPPPTLREVALHARASCDLVRLYSASALTSVPRVQLEQPLATAYSMAPFLNGALDLCVALDSPNSTARIAADMPGARTHTLVLSELEWASRPAVFVAKLLRDMQTATVGSLRVPLSVLAPVLTETPYCDWPRVTRLTVDVFASDAPGDARSNFRWPALDCLRALSPRFPAVAALLLSVRPRDDECPLLLQDAHELVQSLVLLGNCVLPEVHVEGFSLDIARLMTADPEAPAHPRIIFDARE